jgi:uncharacterized protein YegL
MSDEKQLKKIQMLINQSLSERSIGNEGTADLFLEKVEELKLKHGISSEDLATYNELTSEVKFINSLGKSIIANPFLRNNAKTNLKWNWFEELAKLVAETYSCKVDANNDGTLNFYGYDLDREISIFMFLKLAESAFESCKIELKREEANVGKVIRTFIGVKEYSKTWMGDDVFTESFHLGFRESYLELHKRDLNPSEDSIKKLEEVSNFFEQNKDNSYSSYRYNYYQSLSNTNINEEIKELGKKTGLAFGRKAKKSPSALISTKNSPLIKLEENATDSVYLIIDRSGSMWGSKLNQAKEGAISYIKTANKRNFAVGAIAFDDNIIHLFSPTREISEKLIKRVEKLESGGSTNLTDAIKLAHAKLSLNRKKKRVILVITDGMPDNENTALLAANDAKRDGIKIEAIGTDSCRQEFLDKLISNDGVGLLIDRNRLALTMGELATRL